MMSVINSYQTAGDSFYKVLITDKDGDAHTEIFSETTLTKAVEQGAEVEGFETTSQLEQKAQELENWMNEQGISYMAYGSDEDISFETDGTTYTITAGISEVNGNLHYFCDTTHKAKLRAIEIDAFDNPYADTLDAVANQKEYKTLRGVKNYIIRWVGA